MRPFKRRVCVRLRIAGFGGANTHKSDSRFCVKVLLDPTAEQKQTLTWFTLSEIMAPLIHTFSVQLKTCGLCVYSKHTPRTFLSTRAAESMKLGLRT